MTNLYYQYSKIRKKHLFGIENDTMIDCYLFNLAIRLGALSNEHALAIGDHWEISNYVWPGAKRICSIRPKTVEKDAEHIFNRIFKLVLPDVDYKCRCTKNHGIYEDKEGNFCCTKCDKMVE